MEECQRLKIVITSNKPLAYKNNLPLSNRFISGLKPRNSAELFIETLEKNHYNLTPEDILDLIQKQQNYPIKELFPKLEETRLELGIVTT